MEAAELLLSAGAADLLGKTEVQAEHAHEILAVNALPFVAHGNRKGLAGGQGNKFLHFLKGADHNIKFQ